MPQRVGHLPLPATKSSLLNGSDVFLQWRRLYPAGGTSVPLFRTPTEFAAAFAPEQRLTLELATVQERVSCEFAIQRASGSAVSAGKPLKAKQQPIPEIT